MNFTSHHLPLLALALSTPILTAGVRHSRSLGGPGQPIPRAQPVRPAPGVLPGQQTAPIQVPSQTPVQVPQQYLPGMQPDAPVAQPMPAVPVSPPEPVVPGATGNLPDNTPQGGIQATPPAVQVQEPLMPPAPVVIPPPVPVQGQPTLPPIPLQERSTQPPVPMQGQPTLPPSPSGSGERYMLPTYGMAGCGLGSMVFTQNTRSEQWLAAILNDGIFPQSFSITTGTSNCVDIDEEQAQAEQEVFIDSNFNTLRHDAAKGDGESLRAYAELLGCHKEGLYDTFASLSQGQFPYIFSDAEPGGVAERYRDSLKRSRALKTRCDRLF